MQNLLIRNWLKFTVVVKVTSTTETFYIGLGSAAEIGEMSRSVVTLTPIYLPVGGGHCHRNGHFIAFTMVTSPLLDMKHLQLRFNFQQNSISKRIRLLIINWAFLDLPFLVLFTHIKRMKRK